MEPRDDLLGYCSGHQAHEPFNCQGARGEGSYCAGGAGTLGSDSNFPT